MIKHAENSAPKQLIPAEVIERRIYLIRGQKVMLSTDLAQLYDVEPRILVQAVKRNRDRFPGDFMFQLNQKEVLFLRSPIVILKQGRGRHQKYPPYAFTEQGVAMLSSVLNSERAIRVNIAIMRVFVKLREMIASNKDLAKRLDELEKKYDAQFRVVFDAIRQLMTPPATGKQKIGFRVRERRVRYKTSGRGSARQGRV